MRLATIVALLVLGVPLVGSAQEASRETAIYVEALGPTEYASLNLDHMLSDAWAVRAGFQVAGSGRSLAEHYLQVPLSVSRVHFWRGLGFEAGLGAVATLNGQYASNPIDYYGSVGLRTRPFGNGTFLRVEMLTVPSQEWQKRFGVGVGYAF
ncbi:MAG TPA: hypothetical protein VF039_13705 [Longimicrobiales bacterium]